MTRRTRIGGRLDLAALTHLAKPELEHRPTDPDSQWGKRCHTWRLARTEPVVQERLAL